MSPVLVLNVDDYEAARYAKTRLLKNAGFEVQEACNGEEALQMVGRLQPGMILLDVRLPDIDGREICRRLKADPANHAMTVIQTSAAFISDDDIARGYASGADAYITAPYAPEELIRLVRSFAH